MKTILALLMLATPALADHCRVRNNAVVIQSTGAIVTPFAVPVAVPVGVVSPYAYQHSGAQVYGQQAKTDDAQLFEEFLRWKQERETQVKAAVVPPTLLQQNCVACHTKAGAKSSQDAIDHLDMDQPLTAEQKLAASKSLLKGAMPKGRKIDDATRGNLLGELLGVEEK